MPRVFVAANSLSINHYLFPPLVKTHQGNATENANNQCVIRHGGFSGGGIYGRRSACRGEWSR